MSSHEQADHFLPGMPVYEASPASRLNTGFEPCELLYAASPQDDLEPLDCEVECEYPFVPLTNSKVQKQHMINLIMDDERLASRARGRGNSKAAVDHRRKLHITTIDAESAREERLKLVTEVFPRLYQAAELLAAGFEEQDIIDESLKMLGDARNVLGTKRHINY